MSKFKKIAGPCEGRTKPGGRRQGAVRQQARRVRSGESAERASTTYDDAFAMDAQAVEELIFPGRRVDPESHCLQLDHPALIECKKRPREILVKPSWMEHRRIQKNTSSDAITQIASIIFPITAFSTSPWHMPCRGSGGSSRRSASCPSQGIT